MIAAQCTASVLICKIDITVVKNAVENSNQPNKQMKVLYYCIVTITNKHSVFNCLPETQDVD